MRQLENAQVCIDEFEGKYAVKVSTISSAPIAILETQEEAKELVSKLSRTLAPSRWRYVWMSLVAVLIVVVLTTPVPQHQTASYRPSSASVPTPTVPRSYTPQLVGPQSAAPRAAAPVAAAPQPTVPPTPADVSDPFGLKVAPK